MFEQKINETIAYLSETSIGKQQGLTLRQIFTSSMPDSMKKIFEVEVQQWVEEEKKRLLDSPHFVYSEDEVVQLFDQIIFKAVEYATFSRAEFDETLDRSVKLLYNYLCRPQWTMKKYVFADRDNATADSVMESLQYFRDYEYYKLILAEYFDKKQLDVINAKKFENLLENIDEEIVRTFDSRKMARLTEPIFALFNIGDERSEPRIPIEAASIFFDDKNITSVVERLDAEKNKTDTLTMHDLTMLIGEVDFTMSLDISDILTRHAGQLEGLPDMDTNMGRDFDVPDIEEDQIEEATGDLDVPDIVDSGDDFAQPGTDDLPVIEEDDGDEVVLSRDNDFEFDDTYDGGLQSEDEMDAGEFQEYDTDQDGITLPKDVVLEEENSVDSVREDQSEPQDEYQEADGEDGSSPVPEEEDVSADDEINLQDEVDLQDEIQQQDEIDLQDESLQQNETLHDDKDIIGELYEDDVRHHGDIGLSGLDEVELPDIVLDDDALDEGVLDADIMLEENIPVEDEAAELNAEDIFKELELDSIEVLGGEAETTQVPSASGTAPDPPGEGADASTTAAADDDGMSTQKKSGDEADIITKSEVISTYGDIHSRIAASDKKKYVKRLFGKNAEAMENAIDTLNGKSTWREASEYIDELFIKHEVDMYSRVAMKFSDDIYKRYLNKKS